MIEHELRRGALLEEASSIEGCAILLVAANELEHPRQMSCEGARLIRPCPKMSDDATLPGGVEAAQQVWASVAPNAPTTNHIPTRGQGGLCAAVSC